LPASRRSTSPAAPASNANVRSVISVACASCHRSWSTIWRAHLLRHCHPARLADPTMAPARTPPIYTSPQDVSQAFYQAFETRDVDAMMATWAEDEDIVCVHPGGARRVGYEAVRQGFEQLFANDTRVFTAPRSRPTCSCVRHTAGASYAITRRRHRRSPTFPSRGRCISRGRTGLQAVATPFRRPSGHRS
jgi:hypothetical protein